MASRRSQSWSVTAESFFPDRGVNTRPFDRFLDEAAHANNENATNVRISAPEARLRCASGELLVHLLESTVRQRKTIFAPFFGKLLF